MGNGRWKLIRPREIYQVQNPILPTQLPRFNLRIPTRINYTSTCPTNLKQRFKVKLGLNVGKFSQKLGKQVGKTYPSDPPNYQLVNF